MKQQLLDDESNRITVIVNQNPRFIFSIPLCENRGKPSARKTSSRTNSLHLSKISSLCHNLSLRLSPLYTLLPSFIPSLDIKLYPFVKLLSWLKRRCSYRVAFPPSRYISSSRRIASKLRERGGYLNDERW